MRALHSLLRLSARERLWLVQAAALLWAIRLGLWLLPFSALRRLVDRAARPSIGAVRPGALPADRVAWAVAAASLGVPAATCLTQALAARVLLGRRGVSALLRIGVAKDTSGKLEAHAWIESAGRVIVGGSEQWLERYTVLPNRAGEQA